MPSLPDRYPFAEKVPDAGASCATCEFVTPDGQGCRNKFYIKAHGSRDLGATAKRWCCIAWTPKGGR